MTVRSKVRCNAKTGNEVHFSTVYEPDASKDTENARFTKATPWERVVFGKNQIYVLEAIRAEGASPWFSCAHDEFALCMDQEVDVHLVKLDQPAVKDAEKNGAMKLEGEPRGKKMGWIKLKRGHQALLPANCAYQFRSAKPAVIVLQTCKGDLSIERWAEICQTH